MLFRSLLFARASWRWVRFVSRGAEYSRTFPGFFLKNAEWLWLRLGSFSRNRVIRWEKFDHEVAKVTTQLGSRPPNVGKVSVERRLPPAPVLPARDRTQPAA